MPQKETRMLRITADTYDGLREIQDRILKNGTTKNQRALGLQRPDLIAIIDAAVRCLDKAG